MAQMRLQRFLSQAGVASRRQSEKLITAGRVRINGQTVTELGTKVDPDADQIELDGAIVKPLKPLYYVMNKPRQTVCTERDPEGRETVFSLLPNHLPRMFTVGRLDWDTEGLLLVTNDGELAHRLTDPSQAVAKVYEVKIQGPPDAHLERRFNEGLKLDDGRRTKASPTELMSRTDKNAWYSVILTEGMNRQIHRMAQACGRRVLKIRRVQYGPVLLGRVPFGKVRQLNEAEVKGLIAAAGLAGERRAEKYKASNRHKKKKAPAAPAKGKRSAAPAKGKRSAGKGGPRGGAKGHRDR